MRSSLSCLCFSVTPICIRASAIARGSWTAECRGQVKVEYLKLHETTFRIRILRRMGYSIVCNEVVLLCSAERFTAPLQDRIFDAQGEAIWRWQVKYGVLIFSVARVQASACSESS